MLLVRIALMATACVCAPAAIAECSDETLQLMANRLEALGSDLKTGPIAAALKEDLTECQGEPAAHKIASLAYARMAARERESIDAALGYADLSVREAMLTSLTAGADTPTRYVYNANGTRTGIQFLDLHQLGKQAVELMLQAELKSGKAASISGPAKPGDPTLKCDVTVGSMVQHAAYWMKDQKTLTPGGPAFIEKLIGLCPPDAYNGLDARGYRITMLMGLVEANPSAPNAAALLRQAVADSDAIFAQRPDGLHIGWKKTDLPRLDRLRWLVAISGGVSVPKEKWFAAENLGKTDITVQIAAQLDEAYALDMAEPTAAKVYKRYREIISTSFAAAQTLPNAQQREARKMLFTAAKNHADGVWRHDANKALKAPMTFLYNWVDPDYTPPATPAQ